jgi:tRNA G18 (ribose-2'-O)-methylase SpoU
MIVILDNLRSAYNVGSAMRTCDALGVREIHLCGITPGPEDKKIQKTALGAESGLKIVEMADTYSHLLDIKKQGYELIGLEITPTSVDITSIKPSAKTALVIGNEVSGLSEETQKLCDVVAQIPMKGRKESLNVSVAFAIAAYELNRK